MLRQFSRHISFGLLLSIIFVFGVAFAPLFFEVSWITELWAIMLSLVDCVLIFLMVADFLTKCKVDIQRADPDYLILSLYNSLPAEDRTRIHNSRMVVTHLLMNGNRVDEWSWFGATRRWDDRDVMAVWNAATIDNMPPLNTWENDTIRQQICRELTNYFAVNLWCEEIEQGKVSRFYPGGYAKAFKAMQKEDFRG